MKLSDLRLFGDRCLVRFTFKAFGYHRGEVLAVGPDSPLEVGDTVLFALFETEVVLDGISEEIAIMRQEHAIATVGSKPVSDLPEIEPLPPPTDAEQEAFQGAADKAMAAQREKLGLVELTELKYRSMTPSAQKDVDEQMRILGYPMPFFTHVTEEIDPVLKDANEQTDGSGN